MEAIQNIDLAHATLAGLAVIGVVNVVSFFTPNLDSKYKFAISLLVAFVIGFIPAELGSDILERAKEAITVAFAASGSYKIAMKAGGM